MWTVPRITISLALPPSLVRLVEVLRTVRSHHATRVMHLKDGTPTQSHPFRGTSQRIKIADLCSSNQGWLEHRHSVQSELAQWRCPCHLSVVVSVCRFCRIRDVANLSCCCRIQIQAPFGPTQRIGGRPLVR